MGTISGRFDHSGMRPPLPVVALIGPTDLAAVSRASGTARVTYEHLGIGVGRLVARHGASLAVVPNRGVAMCGAGGYRRAGGPWLIGITPDGGPSDMLAEGNCRANADICDETLGGFSWHHQHAVLCELADLMICVGLSCGTIAEIAWTKWVRGPEILVMREALSGLPPEIMAEVRASFVDDLDSLDDLLGSWMRCWQPVSAVSLALQ